ncbi:MAG: heparinase II/III family protein [Polyangiaceae bacterium]|nr:heparinase II/III family protein [Polyangiaceae bacterium]
MSRARSLGVCLLPVLACAAVACGEPSVAAPADPAPRVGLPPQATEYPSLLATPADKARVLARLGDEPFATLIAALREQAARPQREREDPLVFEASPHGDNGATAQAAAFLAWLEDDAAMADKAISLLEALPTDYETNQDFDINIRMARILMCHTAAIDLLRGTPFLDEARAQQFDAKVLEINGKFFDQFLDGGFRQHTSVEVTQNNHPLRTSAAIGYVALAYPEHERALEWARWAIGEQDFLWSERGHYVQADGGVSEGPFYYSFGLSASVDLLLAWEHRSGGRDHVLERDCRSRIDEPPWTDHGCVDGEEYVFENPLHRPLFARGIEWAVALRKPDGDLPPMEDANVLQLHGGAVASRFTGVETAVWDFMHPVEQGYPLTWGQELIAQHLVHLQDDPGGVPEPSFESVVLPVAGQAVFRTGWGTEDLWALVTAEQGPARMTIHDHVDATSFSLQAYGEYLLIDTGYYKPNPLNNARTSSASAHSRLLIDGEAPPPKGALTNFGDTDAFLENDQLLEGLAYVESRQPLEATTVHRAVALVRDRYLVVADWVETSELAARRHTWRLHGNAGREAGGTFTLGAERVTWERAKAGVDVLLGSTAPGLTLGEPPFVESEAPHVHQFDRQRQVGHHSVLDGVVDAVAPGFLAIVAPYRVGAAPGAPEAPLVVARAMPAEAGVVAWTVTHTGGTELVVLREAGAAERFEVGGAVVETDGQLTIVTVAGGEGVALLARGTRLTVDGADRLAGDAASVVAKGL